MSDLSFNANILQNINRLQEMEQRLFDNLESNTTLTQQQKQTEIEKINQLTNLRIDLYNTLSGINNFSINSLKTTVGSLEEQIIAVDIVESELNKSKGRLSALEEERNNKIRLVEINNYYSDKYSEHSALMKIVIFTLIPVIILTVLNKKGLIPDGIFNILIIIIALIGGYFFWNRFGSIMMRDNMNYQEYNWAFDPASAPAPTAPSSTSSTSTSTSSTSTSSTGTCVGQACCSTGLTWDMSSNKCVSNTRNATSSNVQESFITESFITESMINNVLIKSQPGKYNSDYHIGNINPSTSSSFINNSKIN
jgi:hypothetical protein